ncbi:MAG: tyrosine protein phosphatase yvh1, partial [Chrysothrix sp. TS-e1954]
LALREPGWILSKTNRLIDLRTSLHFEEPTLEIKIPSSSQANYHIRLFSLRRKDAVKEAGLTHVVSVMRWEIDDQLIRPYKHLQIEVDDDEEENLIEHFPATNLFIRDALEAGGSVLVHCAMGRSRSATIVIAYMMHKLQVPPLIALQKLRESRGVCEPNSGFWKQLDLYQAMGTPDDVESNPQYQRWLFQREVDVSRRAGMAPEADKIRFEDEQSSQKGPKHTELRCRRCRRALATSQYLVEHKPKEDPTVPDSNPVPPSACAHYFLDPLSWMRPELEQGKLEGRLECPKCRTNVGKYAWQGMQCSCGDWVVPGISLTKGRIDEVRTTGVAESSESLGIRRPPGFGASGKGNL